MSEEATVYVFGVRRKIDSETWYLAFKDKERAENYPDRVTEVASVPLWPKNEGKLFAEVIRVPRDGMCTQPFGFLKEK